MPAPLPTAEHGPAGLGGAGRDRCKDSLPRVSRPPFSQRSPASLGPGPPHQGDLILAPFISEGPVSQIRSPGRCRGDGAWRGLLIQCIGGPHLRFEGPILFQLKTFLKTPRFVLYEGASPSQSPLRKTARASCLTAQPPSVCPPPRRGFLPAPSASIFQEGPKPEFGAGRWSSAHTLVPVSSVTLGKSFPFSEPQFPLLSV